jgi:hypothetical protein
MMMRLLDGIKNVLGNGPGLGCGEELESYICFVAAHVLEKGVIISEGAAEDAFDYLPAVCLEKLRLKRWKCFVEVVVNPDTSLRQVLGILALERRTVSVVVGDDRNRFVQQYSYLEKALEGKRAYGDHIDALIQRQLLVLLQICCLHDQFV